MVKYTFSNLENVVYLELCRRGYEVNIGKTADGEVDFVAQRQGKKLYAQVTQEIQSEKTERREYDCELYGEEKTFCIGKNKRLFWKTVDDFADNVIYYIID